MKLIESEMGRYSFMNLNAKIFILGVKEQLSGPGALLWWW